MNINEENPLIPMGAITGKPSRELIRFSLESYRRVGITQYLIYPRVGCELEYMSEEWFRTCEIICEEARKLGFTSLWLYDEFNWPSGTCGKQVMKVNPDFMMKQLSVYQENGEYKIIIHRNPDMSDLMNPAAVECFLDLTYKRYHERLGSYFGTLIKGVFTDEPEIGYFDKLRTDDIFQMAYYDLLESDYRQLTGSELRADIISGLRNGSEFFMESCNRLLAKRFKSCYFDYLRKWCDQHGVLLTGHLMNETSPKAAQKSNGHILETLSKLSLPGIDEISTAEKRETIEWLTLSTGMYAIEKNGDRGGLAELFALGPCDMNLTQLRKQLWLMAAFGIDHYVLAVAQMEARGNIYKSRYFNSFTMDQPHMAVWKILGEEAAYAAGFAVKPKVCEFNIRYPYHHEPLSALLRLLVNYQCSWRLLLPDEVPDPEAQFVLTFSNEMLCDEKSGAKGYDFEQLYEVFLQFHLRRSAYVTNHAGELCKEVFVRCYEDGTVLVLDLSGRQRQLVLHRYNTAVEFELPQNGVAEFPGWRIILDRPNIMRTEFIENIFEFQLDEAVADLELMLRDYGGTVEVELNGQEIMVDEECTSLPPGFKGLYRKADLKLSPGKHILKLINDAPYYPFMPRGFIAGNFARHGQTLTAYRHDGAGLSGYIGTVTQQAIVRIPSNAMKIRLMLENGDAEVLLDGQSLGVCGWQPYEWVIPDHCRGQKVEFSLIRHTTVGPLFGNNIYAGADEANRDKRKRYAPKNDTAIPGVLEIIWI